MSVSLTAWIAPIELCILVVARLGRQVVCFEADFELRFHRQ